MYKKWVWCLVLLAFFAGCKKTTEQVIDCFAESLLVGVHVNVSAANAKQVVTELRYAGDQPIASITWEYGDGSTETTTNLTGNHTYAVAGMYTIKAKVTFRKGKSSCQVDPTKTVTIQ